MVRYVEQCNRTPFWKQTKRGAKISGVLVLSWFWVFRGLGLKGLGFGRGSPSAHKRFCVKKRGLGFRA